jgi:N-acetylglutamate synthase-like GNAT family acetyltransferase
MIRQFRPQDAPACCRLIHACLESDLSLSPTLRRKMSSAETPENMNERARLFYVTVYEEENRILGIAGLDLNEVRLLCVFPERQRAGIGRALLDHIKTMAPGFLFADIFVYSSIQAAGFYKACGFSEKGTFTFYFGGEALPTIFMTYLVDNIGDRGLSFENKPRIMGTN